MSQRKVLQGNIIVAKAALRRPAEVDVTGGLDLFPNQSSGVLTSTVWGDGLIDNPPQHAIARGDIVRFLPFSELTK